MPARRVKMPIAVLIPNPASIPEKKTPAASPAFSRKLNSPRLRWLSFHSAIMEKAAGKKAPQPYPSKNLEIPRVHRLSENK